MLPAPNFSLIDKEQKAGKRGYFLQLTEKYYLENQENTNVIKIVEKYLATLRRVMAPELNLDATQTLGNHIACGIAAAKVEFDSTLQVKDKIHPYVSLSFFSLWMSSGQDNLIKQEFAGIENYSSLLYLATQIGYIAQRKNGEISVQEMFTNIRPLN